MSTVEIKILGQSFRIKPPEEKLKFYKNVTSYLNDIMTEEVKKDNVSSDIRMVAKVAFRLAAENMELKSQLDNSLTVLERIDDKIDIDD